MGFNSAFKGLKTPHYPVTEYCMMLHNSSSLSSPTSDAVTNYIQHQIHMQPSYSFSCLI